eukprot:1579239-Prymnesium_polylepis.1
MIRVGRCALRDALEGNPTVTSNMNTRGMGGCHGCYHKRCHRSWASSHWQLAKPIAFVHVVASTRSKPATQEDETIAHKLPLSAASLAPTWTPATMRSPRTVSDQGTLTLSCSSSFGDVHPAG